MLLDIQKKVQQLVDSTLTNINKDNSNVLKKVITYSNSQLKSYNNSQVLKIGLAIVFFLLVFVGFSVLDLFLILKQRDFIKTRPILILLLIDFQIIIMWGIILFAVQPTIQYFMMQKPIYQKALVLNQTINNQLQKIQDLTDLNQVNSQLKELLNKYTTSIKDQIKVSDVDQSQFYQILQEFKQTLYKPQVLSGSPDILKQQQSKLNVLLYNMNMNKIDQIDYQNLTKSKKFLYQVLVLQILFLVTIVCLWCFLNRKQSFFSKIQFQSMILVVVGFSLGISLMFKQLQSIQQNEQSIFYNKKQNSLQIIDISKSLQLQQEGLLKKQKEPTVLQKYNFVITEFEDTINLIQMLKNKKVDLCKFSNDRLKYFLIKILQVMKQQKVNVDIKQQDIVNALQASTDYSIQSATPLLYKKLQNKEIDFSTNVSFFTKFIIFTIISTDIINIQHPYIYINVTDKLRNIYNSTKFQYPFDQYMDVYQFMTISKIFDGDQPLQNFVSQALSYINSNLLADQLDKMIVSDYYIEKDKTQINDLQTFDQKVQDQIKSVVTETNQELDIIFIDSVDTDQMYTVLQQYSPSTDDEQFYLDQIISHVEYVIYLQTNTVIKSSDQKQYNDDKEYILQVLTVEYYQYKLKQAISNTTNIFTESPCLQIIKLLTPLIVIGVLIFVEIYITRKLKPFQMLDFITTRPEVLVDPGQQVQVDLKNIGQFLTLIFFIALIYLILAYC